MSFPFDSSPFPESQPQHRAKPQQGSSLYRTLLYIIIFAAGFIVSQLELHHAIGIGSYSTEPYPGALRQFTAIDPTPAPTHTTAMPTQGPSEQSILQARKIAQDALANLVARAPMNDYRFFQRTMPFTGSEYVLANKYAHAIVTKQPFVVGVLGTSNAACHDNEVAHCFPSYFRDGLAPLFEPFGNAVDLRNQAMGGTNSILASLCTNTMLGDDVDVVLLEWLMSDAGMVCAPSTHETLVRRLLQMPKQPVAHFVEIEGGRRGFRDMPFTEHTDEMDSHYDGPNSDYFRPLRTHYADFDMHHMQMLDGLHRVDHLPPWQYETLFITHHPSALGHQYLADQLLYYHTSAFLIALDFVRDAPSEYMVPRRRELPPPLFCGKWCTSEEMPYCLTSFQPRVHHELDLFPSSYVETAHEAMALTAEHIPSGRVEWQRVLAVGEKLHEDRNYTDFKLTWQAARGGGLKTFALTTPRGGLGIIVVCRSPPPWGQNMAGRAVLSDVSAVQFSVDKVPVVLRSASFIGGMASCGDRFIDICVIVGESLVPGPHTLGIEPMSPDFIDVSHVIAL